MKAAPMSRGLAGPRAKKPLQVARITDVCTGCGGVPVCQDHCPVAECMFWIPDAGQTHVDAELCIGCRRCVACPFGAIEFVPA